MWIGWVWIWDGQQNFHQIPSLVTAGKAEMVWKMAMQVLGFKIEVGNSMENYNTPTELDHFISKNIFKLQEKLMWPAVAMYLHSTTEIS